MLHIRRHSVEHLSLRVGQVHDADARAKVAPKSPSNGVADINVWGDDRPDSVGPAGADAGVRKDSIASIFGVSFGGVKKTQSGRLCARWWTG